MNVIYTSAASVAEAVLDVCKLWATGRSKDPSTKVGACIYDHRTGGLFLGYNGFPTGVADEKELWDRGSQFIGNDVDGLVLTKYDLVIHAEVNAVRKALMGGVDLQRATLFCTHIPCGQCMKNVVLSNGITRVIYLKNSYASRSPRENFVVDALAKLGGVKLEKLETYFDARNAALDKAGK